eukprot:jgi/Tetstr1/449587/TSEL_036674.t1
MLEYMLGNPRLQPAADENYHAACYGAFIRLAVVELRKVLAAACATDGITPAFEQRLEAVVHIMEADNDGHQFRLAYLRKRWDTQMHNGDTFALDAVWERYLRHGTTKNLGSPEFTELRALYKDRVYNTNIASVAKTSARQCFGGGPRRNDRDRDGGGGNSDKFKNARPRCETEASRLTVAKDVTKDSGKGKAKAEAPTADKAEGWGARPCRGRAVAFRGHLGVPSEQRCTGVVGMSGTSSPLIHVPRSAALITPFARRSLIGLLLAAQRAMHSRDARYENNGYSALPSMHHFGAILMAPVVTTRELVRRGIEAMYGTNDWGAKVLDFLTKSPPASTYSDYEGKIRLFAGFCIDEEGIFPLDCTEATCVRYIA